MTKPRDLIVPVLGIGWTPIDPWDNRLWYLRVDGADAVLRMIQMMEWSMVVYGRWNSSSPGLVREMKMMRPWQRWSLLATPEEAAEREARLLGVARMFWTIPSGLELARWLGRAPRSWQEGTAGLPAPWWQKISGKQEHPN